MSHWYTKQMEALDYALENGDITTDQYQWEARQANEDYDEELRVEESFNQDD